MQVVKHFSHLNGLQALKADYPGKMEEIFGVIETVDAEACRTKASREVRKGDEPLYSPIEMNKKFNEEFTKLGWASVRTPFYMCEDPDVTEKTLTMSPEEQKAYIIKHGLRAYSSYNETDFVKDKVAVEVQFGKYSFIPYDIFVKHTGFYVSHTIDVGVEIVPMKEMQNRMSSGPGFYERALHEIKRQGRGNPATPIWLIGVAP